MVSPSSGAHVKHKGLIPSHHFHADSILECLFPILTLSKKNVLSFRDMSAPEQLTKASRPVSPKITRNLFAPLYPHRQSRRGISLHPRLRTINLS